VDRRGSRSQEHLANLLDARGKPFEASTRLGSHQPDGIDRLDQAIEQRVATSPSRRQRHDLDV
jgi:hypothetical protein